MTKRIKALSKIAQALFNHLIALATENNGYAKIDNANGTFMAVTVERVGKNAIGPQYSIAHYSEQNGDLMRDPEIVYQVDTHGRYVLAGYAFPISMTQSYMGIYREYVTYNEDQSAIIQFHPHFQNDSAAFTTTWFRNIKSQQGLRPKPIAKTPFEIEMAKFRKMSKQLRECVTV